MVTKSLHTHKLKRIRYKSGNTIFFCVLPDCPFKANVALLLGKRAICWRCNNPFIMSEYSLRLAKPHCENCHQPKFYPSEAEIHNEEKHEADKYMVEPKFPENRELKQGEIPELSLAEQMVQEMQNKDEEI